MRSKRKSRPPTPEEVAEGRRIAETRMVSPGWGFPDVEWDEDLGIAVPATRYTAMGFCGVWIPRLGKPCEIYAGSGTVHPGVGACWKHDTIIEKVIGAWTVAHVIARIEDISPWEALLLAVKRAAAWSSFYDTKLGEAPDDDALAPNGSHHHWVLAAERVNDKLARYSKMAVDAGVAAMLVQRAQAEGEQIAAVLNRAIGAAGLDEDAELRLRTALADALRALDESPKSVTDTEYIESYEVSNEGNADDERDGS